MRARSNCTECGCDTPANVHLCRRCVNDPDYADYRTEWEIWEQEQYEKDMERMMESMLLDEQMEWYAQTEEWYEQYLGVA